MAFFYNQTLIYVVLLYALIYMLWQWIHNRFSRFPVEIVKSSIATKTRQLRLQKNSDKKAMLFIIIGYIFSLAFSLMVMIYLAVAYLSGTSVTVVVWNHFGEMMIETVLFFSAFIFILIGFYFTWRQFKKVMLF